MGKRIDLSVEKVGKKTKPKRNSTINHKRPVINSNSSPLNRMSYIPWGRTLTTNDNYLGKQKTGSSKTRPVVVVDNNRENELAVVPLSSKNGKNRTELKGYQNTKTKQKTYYKHYLEIEDDKGLPIKVNNKFRENHKNMDISHKDVELIRDTLFKKSKTKQFNIKQLDKFKKRK